MVLVSLSSLRTRHHVHTKLYFQYTWTGRLASIAHESRLRAYFSTWPSARRMCSIFQVSTTLVLSPGPKGFCFADA